MIDTLPLTLPLSETARQMGEYVATHPDDETARLAYIDALNECGNHFLASMVEYNAAITLVTKRMIESFRIPAELFADCGVTLATLLSPHAPPPAPTSTLPISPRRLALFTGGISHAVPCRTISRTTRKRVHGSGLVGGHWHQSAGWR